MAATNPRVDVVIPAYNAAVTIGETVASLQAQTFGEFRIIVVDDGSTDGTPAVLDRLRLSEPRIQVVSQPNKGVVDARNAGLRVATAEFLAVQDADDLSDPDRLQRQVDHLDHNPACVAVSGSARHIDADGAVTGKVSIMPSLDAVDACWIPAREPYLMPFGLMRRSALEKVGGYRYVDYAEDTDLYWRLRSVGELTNLPDIVGSYRYHAASATGGASLVNTRVLAANNQLAALSSARRDAGEEDIIFDRESLSDYREARALAGIFALASAQLDESERRRFKTALAAKMLQWIEGRDLQPDLEDCIFIRQGYDERPTLAGGNHEELRRLYATIGARLLIRRRLSQALALLPPKFIPETCARFALRRC